MNLRWQIPLTTMLITITCSFSYAKNIDDNVSEKNHPNNYEFINENYAEKMKHERRLKSDSKDYVDEKNNPSGYHFIGGKDTYNDMYNSEDNSEQEYREDHQQGRQKKSYRLRGSQSGDDNQYIHSETIKSATRYNTDKNGVAIMGYDPVAYFTENKAIRGNVTNQYIWRKATWYFTSVENRQVFMKNPKEYAPQLGGYCAFEVTMGVLDGAIDPTAFNIYENKLYLTSGKKAQEILNGDLATNVKNAKKAWKSLAP